MPGIAAHSLLAQRTLAAWEQQGQAPFALCDAECRNAFHNGALGPDMGLFSRPHALISDLAHYVCSADLCRALVRLSETDLERAYAWGWASHVLADVRFHLLVNRGVGELLYGDPHRAVPYADDPAAHIRVEVAFDAYCHERLPHGQLATFTAALDERSVGFVARAFDATYGQGVVSAPDLLRAHRVCARYSPWLARLNGVHAAARRGERVPLELWPFYLGVFLPSKWYGQLRRDSVAYAACRPIELPEWLMKECELGIASFPAEFLAMVDSELADLPNYNLDLGQVESAAAPYSLTVATISQLQPGSGERGACDKSRSVGLR